jgi:hypothetical protein
MSLTYICMLTNNAYISRLFNLLIKGREILLMTLSYNLYFVVSPYSSTLLAMLYVRQIWYRNLKIEEVHINWKSII